MSASTNPQLPDQEPDAKLLREIKKDSRHLTDLRIAIGAFIDNASLVRDHRQRFLELVVRLRDQLAKHFALKEANGYLEESADEVPRLAGSIEYLRIQHTALFDMISEIAETAQDLSKHAISIDQLNAILESLRAFDFALQQHEQNESQILYEATDLDLGGEG